MPDNILHIPIPDRYIDRRTQDGMTPMIGVMLFRTSPDVATLQIRRRKEFTSAPLTVDQLRQLRHAIELMLLEDFGVSP